MRYESDYLAKLIHVAHLNFCVCVLASKLAIECPSSSSEKQSLLQDHSVFADLANVILAFTIIFRCEYYEVS